MAAAYHQHPGGYLCGTALTRDVVSVQPVPQPSRPGDQGEAENSVLGVGGAGEDNGGDDPEERIGCQLSDENKDRLGEQCQRLLLPHHPAPPPSVTPHAWHVRLWLSICLWRECVKTVRVAARGDRSLLLAHGGQRIS